VSGGNGSDNELLIGLFRTADGHLSVRGPIDDEVIPYGLLERAKLIVAEYQAKKRDGGRIVIPRIELPGLGRAKE
jgi:hypothetical protein